ncbi:MAG: CO dehydrogenase/CO-methylating acetyl-CoA synthase complex subunit beta [Ruminococcus sp.]|nr:CO dehydrogenase/CO-methylating acetyl-CoA synthase complex subunit beta [Ruminococcus sp.]
MEMCNMLIDRIFNGNDAVYGLTVQAVDGAIAQHGADKAVGFPHTAYCLPCYYAVTGVKVKTLGEMKEALGVVKTLMTREQQLDDALMSGVATALCAEFIEALKYLDGAEPYSEPCYGHLADSIIREMGVPLVTGDIPGVAVILGSAPTAKEGVDLIKSYQAQGILVTLVGGIIDQAQELGLKMGYNVRIVPLGKEVTSVIHVVSVALRAALIFGNVTPGDAASLLTYTKDRVPAFVNAFKPVDDVILAAGAGAIKLGFPVITNEDENVEEVPGALIGCANVADFNKVSLEARNIKIKITKIDIPVAFASAFEGEIIRRKDMQVEFDGSRVDCAELVQTREMSEVEDHKITVVGPEVDEMEFGSKNSIAYVVEVAGKKMQPDFEPVIERKFHNYINCIEGVYHTGQRDMQRIRIGIEAFNAGFRIKHIGEVLYSQVKNEFDAVVDKCQVTIYTDPAECTRIRHEVAIPVFDKRDERLDSLTDESVDVYYSCILCQAFSPSHVCVVTPERLGLCGAVSWLDAKATNQLDPAGPCQVITKERPIDENLGSYEDVDEAVQKFSQGALEHVTLYSIMQDPMTSCGCFECICGIEPFSNGVVIANREYAGMTPLGMTFPEMASMTGGGVQTPGFMGHGKHFISSKKFMKAEGGIERIVWMPKELKETVAERLNKTAKELYGIDNFTDMVGDESIATDPEALVEFLTEKGHPALSMDPMM